MKRFVHWPSFLIALVLCGVLAFVTHVIFGLTYWIALPSVILAVLVNGALLAWENEQPGGFNNPRKKE